MYCINKIHKLFIVILNPKISFMMENKSIFLILI